MWPGRMSALATDINHKGISIGTDKSLINSEVPDRVVGVDMTAKDHLHILQAVVGNHSRSPIACLFRWLKKKDHRAADFLKDLAVVLSVAAVTTVLFHRLRLPVVLGYLLGWTIQLLIGQLPEGLESIWFFSSWGAWGAIGLFAFGTLWSWAAFSQGDKIVLRLTGANPVSADDEPVLHNVVHEMAIAAGITTPKIFVIETEALNAFATGMSPAHSAIGVTRGLLNSLDREELQGVIGHEMGHIVFGKFNDGLTEQIASLFAASTPRGGGPGGGGGATKQFTMDDAEDLQTKLGPENLVVPTLSGPARWR